MSQGVDNYIKVAVASPCSAPPEERSPTVQGVFTFRSSDPLSTDTALEQAMSFWRGLPPALVRLAKMSVYRKVDHQGCHTLAEIGVAS